MIVPIITFIIGLFLLSYIILTSLGILTIPSFLPTPKNQNNQTLTIGLGFLSVALMTGLIGYLGYIDGHILRLLRILLFSSGLIFIISELPIFSQLFQNTFIKYLNLGNILKGISYLLVTFLLIKCLISVDWNGDTWMYQLPFAARIWKLVPESYYLMEHERELLYQSFPKLANFLQGLFWSIAGIDKPQAANLVSFFCLILYLLFLQFYLKIPFYISSIAILAVPLIHIAATACYVDLIGNVGVAILILMTYLLYCQPNFLNWRNIIVFTLAGSLAANTKFLLVPIVFIFFVLAIGKIIFTVIKKSAITPFKTLIFLITGFISGITIFATEFINVIKYQNPFYPLKITIAGIVLNYATVPSSDYMSPKLQAMSALQRWIYSLLEIGAFDERRPLLWTIAMDFTPMDGDTFGMGGYFSIYVIFNVILLLILCRRLTPETNLALGLFIILSILTFMQPFSYQLRYYMYWIMVLIALNLFLIIKEQEAPDRLKWISLNHFGLVATGILVMFIILTRGDYTSPRSNPLSKHMKNVLDPKIVQQLEDGKDYCFVALSPHTFLYNSQLHPPQHYSIKAEFMISPEYVKEQCASRQIIAPDDIKTQLNKKS